MHGSRIAIVTGAGRGLGRSHALELARLGYRIVVNDTGGGVDGTGADPSVADAVADEVRSTGAEAISNYDDVSDWDGAQRLVRSAVDQFGGLDVLVNNAGILRDVIFHKMTQEDWDAVVKGHLYGAFNVSRAAAEHFRRQESGAFVHMTSTSGLVGNAGQANYSAAKMGVVGLSKSLAQELSGRAITVNVVAPGFVETDMTAGLPPEVRDGMLKQIPLGRFGSPDDIARSVVFLCSDAAAYVTGQTLVVDGGMTM